MFQAAVVVSQLHHASGVINSNTHEARWPRPALKAPSLKICLVSDFTFYIGFKVSNLVYTRICAYSQTLNPDIVNLTPDSWSAQCLRSSPLSTLQNSGPSRRKSWSRVELGILFLSQVWKQGSRKKRNRFSSDAAPGCLSSGFHVLGITSGSSEVDFKVFDFRSIF